MEDEQNTPIASKPLDDIEADLEAAAEAIESGQEPPEHLKTPALRRQYLQGLLPLLPILKVKASRILRWEQWYKTLGMPKGEFRALLKAERQRLTEKDVEEASQRHRAQREARSQELLRMESNLYRIHAALDELSSAGHDLIELVLATSVSLPMTQAVKDALVWLLVVGAPSSDKTNQVTLLRDMPHVYFLDTLTENAFITGYIPEDGQPPKDLLAELDQRCLVVKELGAIFSLKAELIRKVLGDLQAIYDGQFAKFTGTRGLVEHRAAFPFIGCVTPLALNQHQRYMAAIGPRFLFYRVLPLTEQQVQHGFELSWQPEGRRQRLDELRRLVSAYGWQCYHAKRMLQPETPEIRTRLNELALFLSYGRAVILTERHQQQGEEGKTYTVYEHTGQQREEPFRALQQLRGLARSLAVVHARDHITDHEMELLRRVVLSSMPPDRADALLLFQQGNPHLRSDGGLTRRAASEALKRSYNQAKRLLQELENLGLAESAQEGESKERVYYPAECFKHLITAPLAPLDHLLDMEEGAINFHQGNGETPIQQPEQVSLPQGEVSGNEVLEA